VSTQQCAPFRWAAIFITVIAGAWTLFHLIWNVQNHTADDYWGIGVARPVCLAIVAMGHEHHC
jgi:hypothetical protein